MKKINTESTAFNLAMEVLTIGVGLCTWQAVGMKLEPLRRQSNLAQKIGLSLITYTAYLVVSDRIVREAKDVVGGYNMMIDILKERH